MKQRSNKRPEFLATEVGDAKAGDKAVETRAIWCSRLCRGCGAIFNALNDSSHRVFCTDRCAKLGKRNPNWKGDNLKWKQSGHCRARSLLPGPLICADCGGIGLDRHHKNGNTFDNSETNIEALCRRCHMQKDGRMGKLKTLILKVYKNGVAARAAQNKAKTKCKYGHEYTANNTYVTRVGHRSCRICGRRYQAAYQRRKAGIL